MRRFAGVVVALSAAALAGLGQRAVAGTGATPAEIALGRPGDDIVPEPTTIWNRGITIAASTSEIWPWLAQMGYGRAGFYVPEWIDRLVWRVPAANSDVLLPQYENIAAGDVVADGPSYLAYWRVRIAERQRALVYWTRRHPWRGAAVDPREPGALERREHELLDGGTYAECSWGFYLDAQDAGRTRLLIRTRAVSSPSWLRRLPFGLFDAYLSAVELRTIKRLVEERHAATVPGSTIDAVSTRA